MSWTVLNELGYRCKDGSYAPTYTASKNSGVNYPTRYLLCRCICGDERAVKRKRKGVPEGSGCPSCAAKLANGTDPLKTYHCQRCGKQVKRSRTKYCSKSCQSKTYSAEEEQYMLNLDIYPATVAINRFIRRAKAAGWPKRSRAAISGKMQRMGLTFGYEETHFSRQAFCDLLEIRRYRGKKLTELGMPFTGKHLRLSTKALRNWLTWNQNKAIAFPYFEGCNQESLQFLLGAALFNQYQRWLRNGLIEALDKKPKPIVVNGVGFDSVATAAKASYYSRAALRRSANGQVRERSVSAEWL